MSLKQNLLLLGLITCPTLAAAVSSPWETNPQGQVRLIAPYTQAPAPGEILLGMHFRPAPGWVVYWKEAGDAGYAPKFDFSGSKGIARPQTLWPRPRFFVLPGDIKEYGYENEVVYPIKATRTGSGTIHLVAKIDYLTCKESCIPYRYTLTLDIPAGPGPTVDAEIKSLIDSYLAKVPPDSENVLATLKPEKYGEEANQGMLYILLIAFLGGLILNVMPCVLPVLSIKLVGLLQHAGGSRSLIVRDTLASAAGILISFLVGAALAIVAQNAGHAVGWGIQFQHSGFVIFLLVVVFLFALNLWDIFQIPLPRFVSRLGAWEQDDDGPLSFFLSGMFATLLATPCTAPFLGTAMGFALSQSAGTTLAIFAAAGTGMALPYLVLAAVPSSLQWLPKPGVWMITLKKFLGLLLFATAAWLGWVLYQQLRTMPEIPSNGNTATTASEWIPFDEDKIDSIVATGRPVFVDVTADWCVTCKVNERFVLGGRDIMAEFKKRNVVLMRADWTNKNIPIAHYLAKHGRAGIPFYAFYAPNQQPMLLSELLTKKQILNVLKTLDR